MMAALMAPVSVGHAAGVMEWLQDHAANLSTSERSAHRASDAARLLTLENRETEMYPLPSPDGRYLLCVSRRGNDAWVSRRFSENGDPANRVTDDKRALDSIHWQGNDKVYYLSERAGGLGLWEKIADGEGMQRRIQRLSGTLTRPILLADGAIIATRLQPVGVKKGQQVHPVRDAFNNWTFPGYRAEIVRIEKDGDLHLLAAGMNPALSPDGRSIAFAMPAGRSIHLFRMHTDGSELIQVTDARSVDVQPSWSSDGKFILFTSNRAGADLRHPKRSAWDIWSIDIEGRHLQQITFARARDGAARMGRDGRIYFHSDRAIDSATRNQHQITSGSAHGFHIWVIDAPEQDQRFTTKDTKSTKKR